MSARQVAALAAVVLLAAASPSAAQTTEPRLPPNLRGTWVRLDRPWRPWLWLDVKNVKRSKASADAWQVRVAYEFGDSVSLFTAAGVPANLVIYEREVDCTAGTQRTFAWTQLYIAYPGDYNNYRFEANERARQNIAEAWTRPDYDTVAAEALSAFCEWRARTPR